MRNNYLKNISIFLFVLFVGVFFATKKVYADSYPMTCSLFEVSKINDNGSLSKVECYDNLAAAQNKMRENDDYVVRSNKSLSPTKIIDMNAGLVYTYPYRANSLTQSVYNKLDSALAGTGAKTYLTIHYPMVYLGNKYYDEKKDYSRGWIHVNCHGFDGYADLEYVDFVPYKYIEKGIPITLGGNDKTYRNEQPFKVLCKANTYEAQRNGNYTDLVFTSYRGWSSNTDGGEGLKSSTSIGVAPSFMVQGTKYYSNDGVNFYSDIRLTNLVGTYYNYYQFLPFRTKSKISASTLDSYLNSHKSNPSTSQLYNKGNDFKNNEALYGCNAVLTYAMAIHESGWGTSNLSYEPYNNLFGYGAYDSNVALAHKYPTISDCIASQMADNLANYLDVQCGSYFTMSLGTKGGGFMTKYASDPYWAEKISHYYYDIDKYSNNNNGNLTDFNSYSLALVNTYNVDVKREANGSSQTLYKTANKNGYQNNLITVTLGESNGFTKVQLSNPLDGSGNVVYPITLAKGTLVSYNFDNCVGYISTGALVPLNYSSNQNPIVPQEKQDNPSKMEPVVAVEELILNGNTITLSGIGAISYCNFTDLTKVKHEFVIENLETGNQATFDLTSKEYPGFGLNDGYKYKYVGFEGSVDLTEVIKGSFKLMIRITNGSYVKEKEIRNNDFAYYNMTSKAGNITNKISSNSRYNYRLELEITDSPLDYSLVNIVDNRHSLFAFDTFTINDNLDLHIDGQAFIYYTNYDNPDNVTYKVYLIKDSEHYKEISAQRKTCSLDFNNIISSSYDLTNICFEADGNIEDLENGEYKMIIEIDKVDGTKTYIDYVEMTNMGDVALPSVSNASGIFEAVKSAVRERMILKVDKQ